jgi:hypothetical protein
MGRYEIDGDCLKAGDGQLISDHSALPLRHGTGFVSSDANTLDNVPRTGDRIAGSSGSVQ